MKIILLLFALLIGFCLVCKVTFDHQRELIAKQLQQETTVAYNTSAVPSQAIAQL